ncbi:MAG: helix-turn-helix domain-containing protein [Micrococcales bacterium]|nr:helix-turn-helix domain-containing protein [Micrococcales bacterium]
MDETSEQARFLTVNEVAGVMRVSKMTVYRLLHSGALPGLRVGRSFRVPADALEAYLRRVATTSQTA